MKINAQQRRKAADSGNRLEVVSSKTAGFFIGIFLCSLFFGPGGITCAGEAPAEAQVTSTAEQKQAVKAVREGEQRYRSLIEATSQVVWTTDAQGQVAGDMPLWRKFTGQTFEEIQGWGWINSLHPDDRERTAKIWTQAILNKSLYQTEYRIRRNDGEYRQPGYRAWADRSERDKTRIAQGAYLLSRSSIACRM